MPCGRFSRAARRQRSPACSSGPSYQDSRTFDGNPACRDWMSSSSKRTTLPIRLGNPTTPPRSKGATVHGRRQAVVDGALALVAGPAQARQKQARRHPAVTQQEQSDSRQRRTEPLRGQGRKEAWQDQTRGERSSIHVRIFSLRNPFRTVIEAGQSVAGVDVMSQNYCQRRTAIQGIIARLLPSENLHAASFSNATCRTPIASRLTSPAFSRRADSRSQSLASQSTFGIARWRSADSGP